MELQQVSCRLYRYTFSLGAVFPLHIHTSYVLLFTLHREISVKYQVHKGLKTHCLTDQYLRPLTHPASTLNDHMVFVLE